MARHLQNAHPVGFLEHLEKSDPRQVSDDTLCRFAVRVSCLARRFSGVSCGEERAMFDEMEYGAECVVDHFTPVPLSALEQHRHNQDIRRKMGQEDAV